MWRFWVLGRSLGGWWEGRDEVVGRVGAWGGWVSCGFVGCEGGKEGQGRGVTIIEDAIQ